MPRATRLSEEADYDDSRGIDLNAVAERIAASEDAGDIEELNFDTPPSQRKRGGRTVRYDA